MGKKIISINEGKLSEFKLHSIWLRERLNGSKFVDQNNLQRLYEPCLLYTSPSPRDKRQSRMPSSA